ncbi:hypothetical protein CBS101457_001245 [Exobasidium rhododendri]|nr:hypothetical protein CBS101457_001245 [Exobasidium rhododendri]
MSVRRGQARLLGTILAPCRPGRQSHALARHLYSPSRPSTQAALVNDTSTSHTPSPLPFPSKERGNVVQELSHQQSGTTIKVYATSLSLQCPAHGLQEEFHFDHVWLRDICPEANSVEKDTRQKLFHTSDIFIPTSKDGLLHGSSPAKLIENSDSLPTLQLAYSPIHAVTNAFSAAFSSAPPPSTEPHTSNIPLSVLLEHALPGLYASSHGDIGGVAQPWQASDLTTFPESSKPPHSSEVTIGTAWDREQALARPSRVTWSALLGDGKSAKKANFALIDGLMRDGIAFVTELPTDKVGDSPDPSVPSSPSLARLAESLGEIRHTFYGSLWNVRSLGSQSKNIAYTNLDLGLHMDLCYFQNPPRFQFLHMLRNRVLGGESIFVDSFKVAEEMWANHRELWQALVDVPVGFHYQNDNRHYRYTHPTFELTSPTSGHAAAESQAGEMPRLTAVNYSPPFQSPLPLYPSMSAEKQSQFYRALQLFSQLTLQDRFRYERQLCEGECVIFDNRRVLHSRRGFEWSRREETGGQEVKRWLKGCYVDGDAVWSTYRTLLAEKKGGKLGL